MKVLLVVLAVLACILDGCMSNKNECYELIPLPAVAQNYAYPVRGSLDLCIAKRIGFNTVYEDKEERKLDVKVETIGKLVNCCYNQKRWQSPSTFIHVIEESDWRNIFVDPVSDCLKNIFKCKGNEPEGACCFFSEEAKEN